MSNDNSPFLKRVLIPFWVLRIAFMLILIGVYAWAIAWAASYSNREFEVETGNSYSDSQIKAVKGGAIGVLAAFLFLLVVCLILDIVAIILYARRRLSPKVFLIFNVLQTAFWTAMLILSIIGAAVRASLGIVLVVIVFLLYLGLLIYASVVFHRSRKIGQRGKYHQAPNPGLYESQAHDFQHQAYHPQSTYGNVQQQAPTGQAQEYYSGVPQPATYFNPSTTPQPQQYQAYSGAPKNVSQEAAYELPDRGHQYMH